MKIRKHKTIEIYFVLYLAALILLIPEKREIGQQESDVIARTYLPEMSLNIEQNTLNCFIDSDSLGLKIATIDSVNTFFWSDNIENISFDFYIEDASSNYQQVIENPFKLISFRTIENYKQNKAEFFWVPKLPIFQNKSFIVHVTANATTKKENNDESITYQTVKLKGKFGINIVYNHNIKSTSFDIATSGNIQTDSVQTTTVPYNPYINTPYFQNFNLYLEKSDLKLIASQNWQNTVIASNINLLQDLATKPELNVTCEPENNGGEAFISETSPERITIKGKTPSFGKMFVQIRVIRKYDKEEVKTTFRVIPQGIEHPEFASEMYPEKTYLIKPNLPLASDVKAYIKDGNKIIAVSQEGEKFYFTPDLSMVNKTLVLERYINDKLFGQKYNIKILSYPNPDIFDIKKVKNNEVIIITKCYGKYSKQFNEIDSLEIEGNAKYRELRGNMRSYEDPIPALVQEFIITPLNSSKPFEFKVYAVDKNGKKTKISSYKE